MGVGWAALTAVEAVNTLPGDWPGSVLAGQVGNPEEEEMQP